jgi:NitT/TauT family transport system substrate-binding protein
MRDRLARALATCAVASVMLAAPASAQDHAILAIPGTNVLFLVQYVAADKHFWSDQGLTVDVRYINGIGAMNAVIAGSAEFSMSSGPSITRANARGQKLTALATAVDQSGQDIVIRKDIADAVHFDPNAPMSLRGKVLAGRTIAVGAIAAIPDIVLKVTAEEAGIDPSTIRVTPMQPPEFLAAFARKEIDGFSNGPPYPQQVVLAGTGVIVVDSAKDEPTQYSPEAASLLLARTDYCPAHRSVCEKMVHGVVEAIKLIRTDRAASLAIMKAHFGSYDDKVLASAYDMLRKITPDLPLTTPKMLENGDDMNVAAGFMQASEKLPRYDAIIDNEFVK